MFGQDNNNMNNYGGMMMGGIPQGTGTYFNYAGAAAQGQSKQMNNLTTEEIQRLVKKENQFSLQLTETEVLRAACNHRREDGMGDTLTEDPVTGVCRCNICQYEFKPVDQNITQEDINQAVSIVLDILQTIKLLYIDMSPAAAREYYQIIPLIERIPKLFEFAAKNYAKHDAFDPYRYNGRNMGTMNLFNMLSGALNGGFGVPQQFTTTPNQQMPGYNPQFAQYQQMPMSNGFGYMPPQGAPYPNQQMPGYQTQTAGYQYVPNEVVQNVPGQKAPETTQATTDGKDVNVTQEFKA